MDVNDSLPDAGAPDLSPRTSANDGRAARSRRSWGAGVVLAVLLAAAAFVVFQGLSEATVYFCNADEVGVRDDCRDGRFRVQGTVDQGTITRTAGELDFTLSYNGATVPVRYRGAEPSDMFSEGIAVVVEGRLDDDERTFAGDRILVKHSSEYRAENPDRVPEGQP